MLYYADRNELVSTAQALDALRARLASAGRSSGLTRHAHLAALLVDAGQLAQAIADELTRRDGADRDCPLRRASMSLALAAASALWASWTSGFSRGSPPDAALRRLASLDLPPGGPASAPEGYAHYALYPEAYGEAARALRGQRVVVIGVRSIGTSLAAMVAAVARAPAPVTVRPVGHPFRRTVAAAPALDARMASAARAGASFAVVDEGPGLSGSSFAAVERWLERAGARPGRTIFFPSHPGPPGARSSEDARARWARTARRFVPFEQVLLPRLLDWAAPLVGQEAGLQDLSAGRWRGPAGCGEAARWPPAFAAQERRKLLLHGERGQVLLRFAGVGRYGEAALERARALAAAGFAPPPLGLVHGFLAQRWVDARPGDLAGIGLACLVDHVAAYLAFRARAFPAGRDAGAPAAQLLEALRANATEALGAEAGDATRRFEQGAAQAARLPRAAVDGKLERWEWLRASDGSLVKADAVDHAFGHDLAGAQPIAWDVTGAAVELGLPPELERALAARVARDTGEAASPAALALLKAAYLALRVARWELARDGEADPVERARIERTLAGYREALRAAIDAPA